MRGWRQETLKSSSMRDNVGSSDRVQVAPPSVVEMTVAVPLPSLRPPTATQDTAERHEIPSSSYVPFGSCETNVGRLERVVQLAPPSVVSITAGFSRFPALLTPASQQVVAETQSIAFGHQVAAAQVVGVLSVHVCPPSVDSATAGLSCQVMPDAQQIEAEAQETAVTWKVDGRVA